MMELTQDILTWVHGKFLRTQVHALRMARNRWRTPLRVGIIGCGTIAEVHANVYRAVGGLKLTACVDIDSQRAEAFRVRHGIDAAYRDYRDLFGSDRPDIVSICTWPSTHAEIATEAAAAGVRGILVEKPLSVDLSEADAMVESAEKFGAVLVVGHHLRFDPLVEQARRVIESGQLGPPRFVHAYCQGALLNTGTHAVDAVLLVLGDPAAESIFAQVVMTGECRERGLPAEDACVAQLRLAGGVTALFETGNVAREKFCIHVVGGEGQMTLRLDRLDVLRRGTKGWQTEVAPIVSPHERQAEALVRATRDGNRMPQSNARSARRTQEILIGILASAAARRPLSLPLEDRNLRYAELLERLR